jgi:nucleoid-associated protein YgaU
MPGLGGGSPMVGSTMNMTGGTQPQAIPVHPVHGGVMAVQPVATNPSGIDEAVRNGGGRIEGDVIYVPGIQTNRQAIGAAPVTPVAGELRSADATRGTTAAAGQLDLKPLVHPVAEVKPGVSTSPDRIHVVASGESMFKICQKYYGDGKVWRKLVKYNGMSDSKEPALKIGQKVKVPSTDVLLGKPVVREVASGSTSSPILPNVSVPGRTAQGPQVMPVAAAKTRPYVVKKGDTLAAIAQRELGTVKKAKDILELNKKVIKSADSVPLGATIQLPG